MNRLVVMGIEPTGQTGGWCPHRLAGESDPTMVGMWFGGESLLVDDDLMVVPTERDQIVRVGGSAFAPWDEMVDLESMLAGTTVGLAGEPVAVE
jgi:hypothetical protein